MNIDLSNFNNVDLAEEKYTSTYKMQKVNDLYVSIDSLQKKFSDSKNTYAENLIKTRININPKLVDLNQKKSARISAVIASIIGTALGNTEGSCLPSILNSTNSPFLFNEFCLILMLDTGLNAVLNKIS